jgi:hypothetical protein
LASLEELLGIVPAELRQPFDPREVIARIVDDSDFDEFKPLYGTSLVTSWARLHGHSIGILANARGVLFSAESQKAAQFIQLVRVVLDQLLRLYTGPLFAAALHVWTAAAVDEELRARVIPLERVFARAAYRLAVTLLQVDGKDPAVRGVVSATLDLARGLGLADVLTDDAGRRRRILYAWAVQLEQALAATGRPPT